MNPKDPSTSLPASAAEPPFVDAIEKLTKDGVWNRSFQTSFTSWWERLLAIGVILLVLLVPTTLAYTIRSVDASNKAIQASRESTQETQKNREIGYQSRAIVCEQAAELGLSIPDSCKDPNVIRYTVVNNSSVSLRELLCEMLDRTPGGAPASCRIP